MILRKKPEKSLKLKYPLVIRVSLVIALLALTGLMLAIPKFKREAQAVQKQVQRDVETESVVTEQQVQTSAPPSKATVPIQSEDESLADENVDFQQQDFDNYKADEWSAPPPEPEKDQGNNKGRRFIAFDQPPKPIGGRAAIQNNIKYPEMAREAGIEGQVIVDVFIDKNGNVTKAEIKKGIPNTGLNEAAVNALKRTSFKPAMQRDRKVGVWYTIPVRFRLAK